MFFKQKQTGDSILPPSVQEVRDRLTNTMSSNPDLTAPDKSLISMSTLRWKRGCLKYLKNWFQTSKLRRRF